MRVMIGIDPHKASHTAVAIDNDEQILDEVKVRASKVQVQRLCTWAERFRERTWAVESAGGLGYLVAQQLVAAGETVVDVPAVLASRVRVLGSGRSQKNDPNDARAVAVAALRSDRMRLIVVEDHCRVLRLLVKRHRDQAQLRATHCARLHALVLELRPGGIGGQISASKANLLLAGIEPTDEVTRHRVLIAGELVADIARLDETLTASKARIATAVAASGTSLCDIVGVGPIVAATILAYTGSVDRFPTPGRLRGLQRHRSCRGVLGWADPSPSQPARQPNPQPRHPHRRGGPEPLPRRGPRLLRPQDRRGQDPQGSHPSAEAPDLRPDLPPPQRRRHQRTGELIRWAREDNQERLCDPAWPARILNTGASDKSLPGPNPNATTSLSASARGRPDAPAPPHQEGT